MEADPKPRIYSSPVIMWVSKIVKGKVIGKVNPNSRIGQDWEKMMHLKILEERNKKGA